MKSVRSIVVTGGALALLLGGAPVGAMAQQQPLLGCVKPGAGLLRILQPGETCKANETPLGFNDLPLLVALQQRVINLENTVQELTSRVDALEECLSEQCSEGE
jgi:hypothetical protein